MCEQKLACLPLANAGCIESMEAGLLYTNFGPCQWSHYYLGQIYHSNEVLYETPQETCFY